MPGYPHRTYRDPDNQLQRRVEGIRDLSPPNRNVAPGSLQVLEGDTLEARAEFLEEKIRSGQLFVTLEVPGEPEQFRFTSFLDCSLYARCVDIATALDLDGAILRFATNPITGNPEEPEYFQEMTRFFRCRFKVPRKVREFGRSFQLLIAHREHLRGSEAISLAFAKDFLHYLNLFFERGWIVFAESRTFWWTPDLYRVIHTRKMGYARIFLTYPGHLDATVHRDHPADS